MRTVLGVALALSILVNVSLYSRTVSSDPPDVRGSAQVESLEQRGAATPATSERGSQELNGLHALSDEEWLLSKPRAQLRGPGLLYYDGRVRESHVYELHISDAVPFSARGAEPVEYMIGLVWPHDIAMLSFVFGRGILVTKIGDVGPGRIIVTFITNGLDRSHIANVNVTPLGNAAEVGQIEVRDHLLEVGRVSAIRHVRLKTMIIEVAERASDWPPDDDWMPDRSEPK